jgi:hypothetical protein
LQLFAYYKSTSADLKENQAIPVIFLTLCPHNGINAANMENKHLFNLTTGLGTSTTTTRLTRDGWAEQARMDSCR